MLDSHWSKDKILLCRDLTLFNNINIAPFLDVMERRVPTLPAVGLSIIFAVQNNNKQQHLVIFVSCHSQSLMDIMVNNIRSTRYTGETRINPNLSETLDREKLYFVYSQIYSDTLHSGSNRRGFVQHESMKEEQRQRKTWPTLCMTLLFFQLFAVSAVLDPSSEIVLVEIAIISTIPCGTNKSSTENCNSEHLYFSHMSWKHIIFQELVVYFCLCYWIFYVKREQQVAWSHQSTVSEHSPRISHDTVSQYWRIFGCSDTAFIFNIQQNVLSEMLRLIFNVAAAVNSDNKFITFWKNVCYGGHVLQHLSVVTRQQIRISEMRKFLYQPYCLRHEKNKWKSFDDCYTPTSASGDQVAWSHLTDDTYSSVSEMVTWSHLNHATPSVLGYQSSCGGLVSTGCRLLYISIRTPDEQKISLTVVTSGKYHHSWGLFHSRKTHTRWNGKYQQENIVRYGQSGTETQIQWV